MAHSALLHFLFKPFSFSVILCFCWCSCCFLVPSSQPPSNHWGLRMSCQISLSSLLLLVILASVLMSFSTCGMPETLHHRPSSGVAGLLQLPISCVLIRQCVRDVQERFLVHCHLQHKIPGGNVCLVHYRRDILYKSKFWEICAQPVFSNVGWHPVHSHPCPSGTHVFCLKSDGFGYE